MVFTLALRNLLHDRVRFAVTLVGVVFSTVLVVVQLGLYVSSENMIASMIDHATADLWVVPQETRSFENGAVLPGYERYLALSTRGVASAAEIMVAFAEWRKPSGGKIPIVLVGADEGSGGPAPWNLIAGSQRELETPDAVAVDRTYFNDLGIAAIGDEAEIQEDPARVAAVTRSIRSFTTLPYVFTSLDGARGYLGTERNRSTYVLIKLDSGASLSATRAALLPLLRQSEILTTAEFRSRTVQHWLFSTGAGAALVAGAILGVLVGTVIVGQSLYASTAEHFPEFATLRAIGSSARYIHCVIFIQAGFCAVFGFGLGALVGLAIVWATADTAIPVVMTPMLTLFNFLLTLTMCIGAAVSAIVQVTKLDPATVFTR